MSKRVRSASPIATVANGQAVGQPAGQNLTESTQGGSSLESAPSSSGTSHRSAIASSLPAPGTDARLHSNLNPRLVNQQVRMTRALALNIFRPQLHHDVIVIISLTPRTPVTLRFQSGFLRQHSSFFASRMHAYVPRGQTWFWTKIVKANGLVDIITRIANYTSPGAPDPSEFGIGDNPNDYEDDFRLQYVYIQLLNVLHNSALPIPANDIRITLEQCDRYLKHAFILGILNPVRPQVSRAFRNYGQTLYKAIATDPVPFLLMTHILQDRQMYQEALIYLVGTFFESPWPTSRNNLPLPIQALIEQKTHQLQRVVTKAASDLKLINLNVIDQVTREITLPDSLKGHEIGVLVVTHWWRSSLKRDFDTLKNRAGGRGEIHLGSFFRDLFLGTREWMRFNPLMIERETGVRVLDDRVVRECFQRLREKTSAIAKDLTISGLAIDPATHEIPYLTCVAVNNEDIPWETEFGQRREILTHIIV